MDGLAARSVVLTDHNKMTSNVASHFDGRVEWASGSELPANPIVGWKLWNRYWTIMLEESSILMPETTLMRASVPAVPLSLSQLRGAS